MKQISRAAIREGQRLKATEEGTRWSWGDLLVKSCPKGSEQSDITATVQTFVTEVFPELDEIGERNKAQWFRRCRLTSLAWPVERRVPEVSFAVHEIFKNADDRFKLIKRQKWTVTTAYRAVDSVTTSRTTPRDPSEYRAKLAMKLLGEDTEVAELLMGDSGVRVVLMQAAYALDRERHARVKKEIEEISPAFTRARGYTRTSRSLYRAQQQLESALEQAMGTDDLSDPMRAMLLRQARRAQLVCDFLVSHLESGDRSFEESMKSLLEEEAK